MQIELTERQVQVLLAVADNPMADPHKLGELTGMEQEEADDVATILARNGFLSVTYVSVNLDLAGRDAVRQIKQLRAMANGWEAPASVFLAPVTTIRKELFGPYFG